MDISLIPEPVSIQKREDVFECEGLPVVEGAFLAEGRVFLNSFSFKKANGKTGKIICEEDASFSNEAYTLDIGRELIKIRAASPRAAHHAFQTIRQLFYKQLLSDMPFLRESGFERNFSLSGIPSVQPLEAPFKIPCAFIEDNPRFGWRGFMLDTSRYFYSVPFIKKLLDALSLHHINVFHWHLTDDQGWRLPVPEYPLLTEIGSRRLEPKRAMAPYYLGGVYTEDDIRDIVSFAAARHIEVVPEVDLPGHASAILASYPGLGCTGGPYRVEDRWGIFDDVLCAGNDAIFDLAAAVFNTLARLFPSKYVHIGGDEVKFERWEHCPKCQKRLSELGLKQPRELQSWITARFVDMLAERGKVPIGWDEVLEDTSAYKLPSEVVVMSWRGQKGGREAVKRAHQVIMVPNSDGWYLDYKHLRDPEEPGQVFGISSVRDVYTVDPIAGMSPTEAALVTGGQCNLWSEIIMNGRTAEYMIFPRIAAFAENIWSPAATHDFARFAEKLTAHRAMLDAMGIAQYRGSLG